MRIYFDACVVIYLVERHPRLDALARQMLLQRHRGIMPVLCWSDLTRLETRTKPLRDGDHTLLANFEQFFRQPAASQVAIVSRTFDLATELRARHGLKTPDALHLAAAIDGRCNEFWTNDRRLEQAADGRIAIVTFG